MGSLTIVTSIVVLCLITLLLVALLLFIRSKFVYTGFVVLDINGSQLSLSVPSGSSLLYTLSEQKIFLPSACGGGGTCLQCRCRVLEGGGDVLPTEQPHFTRAELLQGWRLSCQIKVKDHLKIEIPSHVLSVKKWKAKVVSNYNVASFIKEFVVVLPEKMDYQPGGYIQIEIPETEVHYKDIDITAHPQEHSVPDVFKAEWECYQMTSLHMRNTALVERAYSMASYPAEGRQIMLNVRIATPPWNGKRKTWEPLNPGVASSYIFSRKPGDEVTISGPYGEFFINESESEMLYIGGGAGMAPMRSHLYQLFHTLKTNRKVTYWYGGRSRKELFYLDHFRSLEQSFPNFRFFVALSSPLEEDNWVEKTNIDDPQGHGFIGFIHQVIIEQYLCTHESPEEIEYYFCGPPMMNQAVLTMCDEFGVPEENIRFDDFGG